MAWPWAMITLSEAEKQTRRQVLDAYGTYAFCSALLPAVAFLVLRFAWWMSRGANGGRTAYEPVPNSASSKHRRPIAATEWEANVRKVRWWLEDDLSVWGQRYGQMDQWLVGIAWAGWLVILCVHGTGNDYLHLTKRFGIVAASQLPIQYLLGLKWLNPFAYAFRSSHERVNRWHRVLGRVIFALLCCHATLYLNFFVQMGLLKQRMLAPVVALGLVAFTALSLLQTTALSTVRRYSYRVFFLTHIAVAFALPVFIFFHAQPVSTYMVVALLSLVADLGTRKVGTVTSQAIFETIPGTGLVRVTAPLPHRNITRFQALPGAHVYLNIPGPSRQATSPVSLSHILFEFLYNPFTVADVDGQAGSLTIVARHRDGPVTAALARLAGAASGRDPSRLHKQVPLSVEGPYGAVPPLFRRGVEEFDRVLLVAGGIGATFTVPIYRFLKHGNPTANVQMVWAVRTPGDATWAVGGASAARNKDILDDEDVSVFVTEGYGDTEPAEAVFRGTGLGGDRDSGDGEVEMTSIHRDRRRARHTRSETRRRPDLKRIVDEVFKHGGDECVAVFVCGPESMVAELRHHVGAWVMKGRSVCWHSENFGW